MGGGMLFYTGWIKGSRRTFAQRLNLSAAWSLVRVWRKQLWAEGGAGGKA